LVGKCALLLMLVLHSTGTKQQSHHIVPTQLYPLNEIEIGPYSNQPNFKKIATLKIY
jgi:hypothetical protein